MNEIVKIDRSQMPEVERVAMAIAKGGLFGSNDANAILTLCYLAEAEGQHPAVVFRDYHIIQGKPAKKADAMLRDFISSGGKVEWHTLSDECADATFSHPSGSARIDWTLERAKQARLTTPMWSKYPRQMLRSRVISEGVRTVFPGATSGLYETGEVQDITYSPAIEAREPDADEGQSQGDDQGEASPPASKNWGGRYPTKTALKKAMHEHHAEIERIGLEGVMDDLDAYLSSPEYHDFIAQATEHAPYYLEGERHPNSPPEFIQTFKLETKSRDMIAIRGNQPLEKEDTQ